MNEKEFAKQLTDGIKDCCKKQGMQATAIDFAKWLQIFMAIVAAIGPFLSPTPAPPPGPNVP